MNRSVVNLYSVELLNGENVIIKNRTGDKVETAFAHRFIREFKLYRSCGKKEIDRKSLYCDLDPIRTVSGLHEALVESAFRN